MRLFQRIGDIIAANLNDLVDRFEDPEVMLKQAIREMDTMIDGATASAVRAIATERLLSKDLSDHEQNAVRCARGPRKAYRVVRTIWPARRSPAHTSTKRWPSHSWSSAPRPSKGRRSFAARLPR